MVNFKKNILEYNDLPFKFSETNNKSKKSVLILESGDVFLGNGFGSEQIGIGELCFNTSITGYQEILTDPSYSKQIINFTFPHIGNVGTNQEDHESNKSFVTGVVTRQIPTQSSSWRATNQFDEWLKDHKIPGISGVDTRLITKKIRMTDSLNALIYTSKKDQFNFKKLFSLLKTHPSMKGLELSSEISTEKSYNWTEGVNWLLKNITKTENNKTNDLNIVVIDFGIKKNILRNLYDRNAKIIVLPQNATFQQIMNYNPSGIFLSNGPGDPSASKKEVFRVIEKILTTKIPTFGICIGHQLLAIALGGKTIKMKQGHRGANHPVKNLKTNNVEITSQNHGFVLDNNKLPSNLIKTHVSLFDGSIEGIEHKELPIFSVQFHPEASPGPTDTTYLFDKFFELILKYYNAKKN